jgi:hypothetical protein
MKNVFFLLLMAILLAASCNKDKRASRRFMKPGTWQVKEVSVAGNNLDTLPTWTVNDCDIYENLCVAKWNRNGVSSQFYWQFNDKAKTFKLSRVVPPAECANFYTELVEQQTYQYSGVYDVRETTKTRKVFESTATIGYPGQLVRIVVETE